jgi:TonB family protein
MRALIYFIALVALVVFSLCTTQAQETKPTPSPSPSESEKQQTAKDRIYTGKEVDVKAKLKRPFSDPPEPGPDCNGFSIRLLTVLKIVLHKSGIISEVNLVKGTGCSYDKEAIRVARKLKFEPAQKDGQPVSQYMIVEYEYHKR